MASSKKPLGVGIIGLGIISGGYLQLATEDPRIRLVGISDSFDPALKKAAEKYSPQIATTDYKDLLASPDVDIAVVCTPHYLHYPMVMAALKAGKHVICEKPLAMNAKEGQKMIAAAKAARKRLLVGLNMRTGSAFRAVEKAMKEGKLGRVFMAKISYLGHELERMLDPRNWKCSKEKAGGGVLLDGGYHVIDIMNMLMGEPQKVHAVTKKCVVKLPNKAEDNAILLIEYPRDVIGEVTASFTIKNKDSKKEPTLKLRLEVYGTEGSAWCEYTSSTGTGWKATIVTGDVEQDLPIEPFQPDWIARHCIDVIVDKVKPIVTAEDALRVHKIVDAAYKQTGMLKK